VALGSGLGQETAWTSASSSVLATCSVAALLDSAPLGRAPQRLEDGRKARQGQLPAVVPGRGNALPSAKEGGPFQASAFHPAPVSLALIQCVVDADTR
jgi:hypothetical protein